MTTAKKTAWEPLSPAEARAALEAYAPHLTGVPREAIDRVLSGHASPWDAELVAQHVPAGAKVIAWCEAVMSEKKKAPKKAAKKAAKKKAAKKKTKKKAAKKKTKKR